VDQPDARYKVFGRYVVEQEAARAQRVVSLQWRPASTPTPDSDAL
jgi:hypothetical protein